MRGQGTCTPFPKRHLAAIGLPTLAFAQSVAPARSL